jgi:xanthine dehydrogenase YagS FAD-binding subunit
MPPHKDPQRETMLEPGEIVTDILIPPPVPGLRSPYRKVRARRAWDFALAGVALAVQIEEDKVRRARVVFSGAAPVPWRSRQVEETILGKRLVRETDGKAAEAAVKDAEPMKQKGYKVPLLKAVVEEELSAVAKRTQPT